MDYLNNSVIGLIYLFVVIFVLQYLYSKMKGRNETAFVATISIPATAMLIANLHDYLVNIAVSMIVISLFMATRSEKRANIYFPILMIVGSFIVSYFSANVKVFIVTLSSLVLSYMFYELSEKFIKNSKKVKTKN